PCCWTIGRSIAASARVRGPHAYASRETNTSEATRLIFIFRGRTNGTTKGGGGVAHKSCESELINLGTIGQQRRSHPMCPWGLDLEARVDGPGEPSTAVHIRLRKISQSLKLRR